MILNKLSKNIELDETKCGEHVLFSIACSHTCLCHCFDRQVEILDFA